MRRAQGYLVISSPNAPDYERDTFTCVHCNVIVPVEPAPAPMVGGFCRMCMANICDACCDQGCTPFEKKLKAIEARDKSLRSMGF